MKSREIDGSQRLNTSKSTIRQHLARKRQGTATQQLRQVPSKSLQSSRAGYVNRPLVPVVLRFNIGASIQENSSGSRTIP